MLYGALTPIFNVTSTLYLPYILVSFIYLFFFTELPF